MLPKQIFTCEKFIKQHNYINYCEAIIYPNGNIQYAVPSHQNKLIEIYMNLKGYKSIEETWNNISVADYSIEWLVNETNCVSVWYNMIIQPNTITNEQKNTIKQLINTKIINLKNKKR